jgi:hypothetical protein
MKSINIQICLRFAAITLIICLTDMVSGQTTSDGTMPQYLYEEFSKSTIRMKNGQMQPSLMNFNTVTGMMVFIKGDNFYDLINQQLIDTVYLNESRFIPVGKTFYEVLVPGSLPCFIEHKGSLLPAGKPVGYGGTSQVASSDYVTTVNLSGEQFNLAIPPDYIVRKSSVYWVRKGTEMLSFQTEKQLLKIFPEKADQIKSFIKQNHFRLEKPKNLSEIIRFTDSLQ